MQNTYCSHGITVVQVYDEVIGLSFVKVEETITGLT